MATKNHSRRFAMKDNLSLKYKRDACLEKYFYDLIRRKFPEETMFGKGISRKRFNKIFSNNDSETLDFILHVLVIHDFVEIRRGLLFMKKMPSMKTMMIPKLKTWQLPALFALISGCRLVHDESCPRCKKLRRTIYD
ncbi:MAG: hypothetical protein ABIE55_03060 [Candidatus Aenigmatarchaeota archaeon]